MDICLHAVTGGFTFSICGYKVPLIKDGIQLPAAKAEQSLTVISLI